MTLSARETGEAGRRGGEHRMAAERTAHALMTEGTVSAAWWSVPLPLLFFIGFFFQFDAAGRLTAELLEHMLRADFFCLMQMLAKAFHVPGDLGVDEVLQWIAAPSGQGRIERFFASSVFVSGSLFEPELGTMTAVVRGGRSFYYYDYYHWGRSISWASFILGLRQDRCLYLRHADLDAGGLNLNPDATVEVSPSQAFLG